MSTETTETPIYAGIYLRISEDRRDGAGVERQEKECRELADRIGWLVIDVFTDNDISASSFSRKRRTDHERELGRAKAQLRAGLLMTLESPAARAGQIARQILLFGRPLPIEELVGRIDAITVRALRDLAGELITGSMPTVAAVGPLDGMISREKLAERFGARASA